MGPRLVAWNSLLVRLEDIQLSDAPGEFRWNLQANDTFSVDSLYKAILQSNTLIDDNKKTWKIRIPLKNKKMDGIFIVGLYSPKIILLSRTGMEVLGVFSVIKMRVLNTCSSGAGLLDLYDRSSK
jgi:hypothetical protein